MQATVTKVDAIRSIGEYTLAAEWAEFMKSEKCTWRFNGKPSRLTKGSLIFFALHGFVQGIGEYASTSEKRNECNEYVVTTINNKPLIDLSCVFEGVTSLRYLDTLPMQRTKSGRAMDKTVIKKLVNYAKQYRRGTFESDHRLDNHEEELKKVWQPPKRRKAKQKK